MMSRPPRPGALGAVADLGRMLVGMRLLVNVLLSLALPLPLWVMLPYHTLLISLTRSNHAYCQTEVRGLMELGHLTGGSRDCLSTPFSHQSCPAHPWLAAAVTPALAPAHPASGGGAGYPADGGCAVCGSAATGVVVG